MWDYIELKSFFTAKGSKGNHKKMKKSNLINGKIFANMFDKCLFSKIHKEHK